MTILSSIPIIALNRVAEVSVYANTTAAAKLERIGGNSNSAAA